MKIKIHEMSFSGLQTYLMCPQKFRYSNIDKVQSEFTPVSLAFGSSMHDALETYYNALTSTGEELSTDVLVNILKNGLEDESILFGAITKDELVNRGKVLLDCAIKMPVGKVVGTEVPVEIPITNSFSVIGRIDLLTEESGKTIITDFKTAAKKPSQSDVDSSMQLTTYSIAYPESEQRIRALVKSSKPGTYDFSTTRGLDQQVRVRKLFSKVKDAIEAGVFYPHESWACSSCQYYNRCQKDF